MENFSATNKIWKLRNNSAGSQLAQQLGLPDTVGKILSARQPNKDVEFYFQFLTPKLSHLPDPNHLIDMKTATSRIFEAIKAKQKIAIFGDYDVDGACASAIFIRYFKALGIEVVLYIPDRIKEGYGPNVKAMETLAAQGVNLLITVDCGSTAVKELEVGVKLGMDIIITDHHQCPPVLPKVTAVVNPNRVDENSECTMLCGAGMAFYVLMALNRLMREENYFTENNIAEPDLRNFLDLVALATICDLVPLTGANRVLVQKGLQVLNQRQNLGISALAEVSGCTEAMGTYHLGFQLGPRLNAGGRLAECDLGAKLLSTDNQKEAQHTANRLNLLNTERKSVQEEVQEQAMKKAESQAQDSAIVVSGTGWHPGVVGIVAARIKEQFYRPTFVLSIGEDGTATGSGRSISGVDIGKAVSASSKFTQRGGGHAMAAGVTVEQSNIENFAKAIKENVAIQIADNKDIFTPTISIDAIIQPASATMELLEKIAMLEPYGSANAEPTFAFSGVILADCRSVGADKSHLKLRLAGPTGRHLSAIAFGAMKTELGPFLQSHIGQKISVTGTLKINTFNGQSNPDLQIKDACAGTWEG